MATGNANSGPSDYDDIAEWYDALARNGTIVQDAATETALELVGDPNGLVVLDLACGQGVISRHLSARGAWVLGVDTSMRLLKIARSQYRESTGRIEYAFMNAENLGGVADSCVDGVVCNLALMDIADLSMTSASVARTLKPGGWFVFTVMHPCFQTPDAHWIIDDGGTHRVVGRYFDEGRWFKKGDGFRARVGAVHRTLSTCFNALSLAGLSLEKVLEPQLIRESDVQVPAYDQVPAILAARFRKSA